MAEKKKKDVFNMFEDIYENTLRKGETFSYDMGKFIEEELQRIYKERDEYLKKMNEDK